MVEHVAAQYNDVTQECKKTEVYTTQYNKRVRKRKNPPLVTGNGTNIKPNVGEIILFRSTLIDCGGMSCQDKKNFVVRQKQFERINKKKS